ncbi:MAG: ATP-dependent endonuclease [Proteiniphilum sp.]
MYISSLRVRNFRSIRDETLPCDRLTALVGANGAGKSSFLQALYLFYHPGTTYTVEDFYNQDTSNEIIITVTFAGLNGEETELFKKYIVGDTLTVEKVMTWPAIRGSQKYHGSRLKNPDFDAFRSASGAAELRRTYNQLRDSAYPDLPSYSNKDAAEAALQEQEEAHPERCTRQRDEGQFFGFNEVGGAHLERFTRFIYIPPVREAAKDAADGKNSVMSELLDLVVRKSLMSREDLQTLQRTAQSQYDAIVDPEHLPELTSLGDQLTRTLRQYAPGTSVSIDWSRGQEIAIPMPEGRVKLVEDGYPAPVENTGHGLQRAFIITLLQHLALVQAGSDGENLTETPEWKQNVIFGIEEPELYQHPNRQRHLSSILERLCSGGIQGATRSVQVIYTTHSPLFVDIGHFERIKIVRKVQKSPDLPKETMITSTTPEAVQTALDEVERGGRSSRAVWPLEFQLRTIMTPIVNEGFFSDVVVLVEGEEDRAALIGVAKTMEIDLNAYGVSVIPCNGKGNLPKVGAVFRQLGIPLYVVWDSDKDKGSTTTNHRLLRLCGQPEEDWPEGVFDCYACFRADLTKALPRELGEEFYDRTLAEIQREFDLGNKDSVKKNPLVVAELINRAKKDGISLTFLEETVGQIVALRGQADGGSGLQ